MALTTQSPNKNKASTQETLHKWSFFRDEFPVIRKASIVFFTCFLIGLAMVSSSQLFLKNQVTAMQEAQSQEIKSQEKYRIAIDEKREIKDYQAQYNQLASKGFVGLEKRLDLIESIDSIQKDAALLPVNYEISEERLFQVDPSIGMETFELRGSKVVVKMNLLHELDLMHFLDNLRASHVVGLQNCHITRLTNTIPGRLTPRLHAECTLYWITISKPDENAPAL